MESHELIVKQRKHKPVTNRANTHMVITEVKYNTKTPNGDYGTEKLTFVPRFHAHLNNTLRDTKTNQHAAGTTSNHDTDTTMSVLTWF